MNKNKCSLLFMISMKSFFFHGSQNRQYKILNFSYIILSKSMENYSYWLKQLKCSTMHSFLVVHKIIISTCSLFHGDLRVENTDLKTPSASLTTNYRIYLNYYPLYDFCIIALNLYLYISLWRRYNIVYTNELSLLLDLNLECEYFPMLLKTFVNHILILHTRQLDIFTKSYITTL